MSQHLGRRPEDPDYGMGEHTIDCDDLGLLSEREITDRLVRAFQAPAYRPPRLPRVAMELMTLSHDPEVEFAQIERLLEQDAVLAGEILSVARSAFYSRARQVTSLHEALVRLGLSKLRQIVMQAAMELRVFRSKAYEGCIERLRDHSRAAAHLARIISMYTPIDDEQAFLCGLLHDVGIAGILLVLGDAGRGKSPPDLELLWPAIHGAHSAAGTRMVDLWGLPPEFGMAVGAHHRVAIEGHDHPLAATLCLAEALAVELDIALVPGRDAGDKAAARRAGLPLHAKIDQSEPLVVERARQALELDDPVMKLIRSDAAAWLASEAEAAKR